MDILIPLGKETAWENNELRYCLRSIERFATGFDRIFVIGEDPGFLKNGGSACPQADGSGHANALGTTRSTIALHLCKEIPANRDARIAHKILWAFENTDVSDAAVMFNDDYVLTAPVDLSALPYYQRGQLSSEVNVWHGYKTTLLATRDALRAIGKPTFHYDIHVPIIYRRAEYVGLRDWWERSAKMNCGFVVKSVYANNVLPEPGPYLADCKLRNFNHLTFQRQIEGRFVFSYNDNSLRRLKPWLKSTFPQKSRWEIS